MAKCTERNGEFHCTTEIYTQLANHSRPARATPQPIFMRSTHEPVVIVTMVSSGWLKWWVIKETFRTIQRKIYTFIKFRTFWIHYSQTCIQLQNSLGPSNLSYNHSVPISFIGINSNYQFYRTITKISESKKFRDNCFSSAKKTVRTFSFLLVLDCNFIKILFNQFSTS